MLIFAGPIPTGLSTVKKITPIHFLDGKNIDSYVFLIICGAHSDGTANGTYLH